MVPQKERSLPMRWTINKVNLVSSGGPNASQDSKFICLVLVPVKRQRFGDAKFSGSLVQFSSIYSKISFITS